MPIALNYTDELRHFGTKGMKWGVRRYQNADGSLTSAGKARYNDDGSKKDPRNMTDDELKSANARLQAEQNYRQLTGRTQPSKVMIRDTAIKVGVSVVASAGATLLINKLDTNNVSVGRELTKKVVKNCGLASLTAIATSAGGQVLR